MTCVNWNYLYFFETSPYQAIFDNYLWCKNLFIEVKFNCIKTTYKIIIKLSFCIGCSYRICYFPVPASLKELQKLLALYIGGIVLESAFTLWRDRILADMKLSGVAICVNAKICKGPVKSATFMENYSTYGSHNLALHSSSEVERGI